MADPIATGRQIYDYFIARGLSPHQAAAIAGNMAHESGGNIGAVASGDNYRNSPYAPHSFGLAQWNGPRLTGLVNYARQQGANIPQGDFRDPAYVRGLGQYLPFQTQLGYAWNEMQGPEADAYRRITTAPDLSTAVAGAVGYHRPQGYSADRPEMSLGYSGRLSLADQIMRARSQPDAPLSASGVPIVAAAQMMAPPPPRREVSMPPIFSGVPGFKDGGRVVHGLDINIEHRKGSTRSGVSKDGNRWSVAMPCAYGDIKRTKAADGERVDCYIGSDPSDKVFVVDQVDAKTGKYDEAKVLMNFPSKRDALAAYEKAFSDGKGRERIGSVSEMSVDGFRDWLKSGNTKKPVGDLRRNYADGGMVPMAKGYAEGGPPGTLNRDVERYISRGRDAPYYLPEEMVGDVPYRYQGLGLHGVVAGLSALLARRMPKGMRMDSLMMTVPPNAGYAAWTWGNGRTDPHPNVGPLTPLDDAPYADGGPVQPYSSRFAELMLNARPYNRQPVEPLPPNDGSFVPSNLPPERQGGPVRIIRDLDGDGYRMLPGTNRGLATRNWLQTGLHDGILPPAAPQTTDRSGALGKGILPGPQASLEFARGGTPMTKRYADGGAPLIPGGLPPLPVSDPMDSMDFMPETARRAFLGPRAPVASSGNTAMGDLLAHYYGNPNLGSNIDVGRAVSGLERGAGEVLSGAANLTGIPLAADAGRNMAAAVDTGDILRGFGAAGEGMLAALPAARTVGRLATTVPRTLGMVGGYAVAPALAAGTLFPSEAGAQGNQSDDGLTPDLRSRYRELQAEQRKRTLKKAEREELGRITDAMTAHASRRSTSNIGTEDRRREEGERLAREAREANMPIKELYPGLGMGLGGLGLLGGAYAGARLGRSGVNTYNTALASLNQRWGDAIARAQSATPGSRVATQAATEARAFQAEVEALQAAGPGNRWAAPVAGATAGEFGMNLPVGIDYWRALPNSELYNRTIGTMTDPWAVTGRIVGGALLGGGPAEFASMMARTRMAKPAGFRAETSALPLPPPPRTPRGEGPSSPPSGEPPIAPLPPAPAQLGAPTALPPPPTPSTAPVSNPASASPNQHHIHRQNRRPDGTVAPGFVDDPAPPRRGRRAIRDADVENLPDHDPNSRLLRGRKDGGLVNRALELARKFGGRAKFADGGAPTDNAAWEQIGDERYQVAPVPPLPVDPLALLGMRFGFRGAPSLTRGPWTPPEPRPNVVRQAKQPGDDSIGQNIYEALLGRTRRPGEAVASPGSGWWMVGGQPIPKPSNPLPWAVAGGVGYLAGRAGYNAVDSLLGASEERPPFDQAKADADHEALTRRLEEGWRDYRLGRQYGTRGFFETPRPGNPIYAGSDQNLSVLPGAPYAHGGHVSEGSGPVVAGGIVGDTGGREDAKPVSVKSGSFVIPADCVAALGTGNSLNGMKALERQFGKASPHAMAAGGSAQDVPIRISDGEYVLDPAQVAQVGGGNMERGHAVLDKLVLQIRKNHIATLKQLPRPARD